MNIKTEVIELVEKKRRLFCQTGDAVWDHPEIGFEEYASADILIHALEQEGFAVEQGLAGMKTAFRAVWGSGHPVIGFLGEFDALAGFSQRAGCTHAEPLQEGAPGHGCGHNLLGAGSLGAAVAVKDYLSAHGLEGTVVCYGCPAEETGCGKVFMARDGVFNELDAAITWHPDCNTRVITTSTLADSMMVFRFQGVPAHAAATPHLGRSALDAAELMNVGVQFLREHMIDSARVHYAFLDVGGQAPNVVQSSAALYYDVRAPKLEQVRELVPRVVHIAQGAAMMTDTQVTTEITSGMSDYVPNLTLSRAMGQAMEELGDIPFSEQALAQSREFGPKLTTEAAQSRAEIAPYFSKEEADRLAGGPILARPLPYQEKGGCLSGSTDVGDVSYVVPTAQCNVATAAFGTQVHTWQMTAQGKSEIAHEGMLHAAKIMAYTALKLVEDPELLKKAQAEHRETAGAYTCPIPKELKPVAVR